MKREPMTYGLLSGILLLAAAGCTPGLTKSTTSPSSEAVRPRQTWSGVAENHMAGPFLSGAGVYVDLPNDQWPEEVDGKRVVVVGEAVERHDLPVFIPKAGDPPVQGIPVPEGTDLYKASARVVIEHATWTLAPDRG